MTRAARRISLCLLIVVIGFVISGYLLSRSFALVTNTTPAGGDVCEAVFGVGCDESLRDETTWVLGIPLAGWGVVYYATLASLLIMALVMRDAFAPEALLAALLISLAGVANSVVLLTGSLIGASPLCPLCIAIHVLNVFLVLAMFWANKKSFRELIVGFSQGLLYVLGRKTEQPNDAAWKVVGFVTVLFVAVVSYQWIYVEVAVRRLAIASEQGSTTDPLTAYLKESEFDVPVSELDPGLGPDDAQVTMVVFSDFECPHCARLAEAIDQLRIRYGEELRIVFKHFPLSTTCNSRIKRNLHPRSCALAWAADAAHRQGSFWAFHDAAMAAAKRRLDDAAIDQLASEIGLNVKRFSGERTSNGVRERVAADVSTGIELGVRGTPTVFLNGRRVALPNTATLETLVEHELQRLR